MRSVKAYVDRFVVIDSVFASNPLRTADGNWATHSTDNTKEVAHRVAAAWPPKPLDYRESGARLIESYARNAYLELVEPPDWVLIIDGDEVLYGDHAQIDKIFTAIRIAAISSESISIPVYTTAVNVPKAAPDITEEEFSLNPVISTMGWMPRLVATAKNLRYEVPALGYGTPILAHSWPGGTATSAAGFVPPKVVHLQPTAAVAAGDMFLINNHIRQSLDSYKNDYAWETQP